MRTQFTTRLPEPLASALATQAQANHRSANAELNAILRDALSGTQFERATVLQTVNVGYAAHTTPISGTPATPTYLHGHPLHKAVFLVLSSYTGSDTFEDGVRGLIAELKAARAALQRLIDDSAALRANYEDLDAAVEQAQKLLRT